MRPITRLRRCALGIIVALALAGCSGGDSNPSNAAGGGIPPQGGNADPQHGVIGQSEGYPDSDSAGEAQE